MTRGDPHHPVRFHGIARRVRDDDVVLDRAPEGPRRQMSARVRVQELHHSVLPLAEEPGAEVVEVVPACIVKAVRLDGVLQEEREPAGAAGPMADRRRQALWPAATMANGGEEVTAVEATPVALAFVAV